MGVEMVGLHPINQVLKLKDKLYGKERERAFNFLSK